MKVSERGAGSGSGSQQPAPETHIFRRALLSDLLSLYGVQAASFLLPLVTLPYLSRVLGVEPMGRFFFAQAFAMWTSLLLEYGFNLSATRDVASHRHEAAKIEEIAAGVLGAKGLLAMLVLVAVAVAYLLVPAFRQQPTLLAATAFLALAQGISPTWFFQGMEKLRIAALLDLAGRFTSLIAIFLFVTTPAHEVRALLIQAAGTVLPAVICYLLMYRMVRFRRPRLRPVVACVRAGLSVFFLRGAVSLYTTANAFLVGVLAPGPAVAYFGGADKIMKAVLALLTPATQAIYPRMSGLVAADPARARSFRRTLLLLFGLGSAAGAAALFAAAPLGVQLLLGPGYEPAIALLRILSLQLPMVALSNVLGVQVMLPLRMDRSMLYIIVAGGAVNLSAAVIAVPRFGATAMSWSVVAAETLITVSMTVLLVARGVPLLRGERCTSTG